MEISADELAYVRSQGLYVTEKCGGCGMLLNQTFRYTIAGKSEVYCSAACRDLTFFADPREAKNRTYIRLLGDRKGIEVQTKVWDKVIIDRARELREWVGYTVQIIRRGVPVFIYINNHYAGHSPATVRHFQDLYQTIQEPKS
jgi:uncharacterized protein YecE (DUF72 family)